MARFSRAGDQANLQRYWDALVTGAPPDELDRLAAPLPPDLVDLVARIRAAHTRRLPDPTFITRLERQAMDALTRTYGAPIPLRPDLGWPPRPAHRPRPAAGRLPNWARAVRRWDIGGLATAALVILVLAGSLLTFGGGHRLFQSNDDTATPVAEPTGLNWPQYRGNAARTGEMPGPGVEGTPTQLWAVDFGGPVTSSPAIVGGTVYIGSLDGIVHALDAATGADRWTFQAEAGVGSSPAVADGLVYLGDDTGTLYALDASTGDERWRVPNGPVSNIAPAVVDGVVYVGGQDANLYALDGATGEEVWTTALPTEAWRSTAVADGIVYVGCQDGTLVAVDATTGTERWRFVMGVDSVGTPTLAYGSVFVSGALDGTNGISALDPATGAERWRFVAPTGISVASASAGASLLFTPSGDGSLYALDPTTGAIRWRFERDDPMTGSPAIVDGVVYFGGEDGSLYAADAATGTRLWRYALDGRISYGPAVASGVIYVGTENNHFYAIGGTGSASTGGEDVMTVVANQVATTDPTATSTAGPDGDPTSISAPVVAQDAPVELLWRSSGGPDPLLGPAAVAVHPDGTVWVLDNGNNRFQIFSADGVFLETWGEAGSGEGQFALTRSDRGPGGWFTFDAAGNLYVADFYNARVQKFDRDRNFVLAWGTRGTGDGQFLAPEQIVVDPAGNVWVSDIDATTVQQFDADGRFLAKIDLPANPVLIGDGIALVSPSWTTHRITVFDVDGTKIAEWGVPGDGPGEFNMPLVVVFDGEGRAFVGDHGNGRVQVLDQSGRYLGEWDGSGTELEAFAAPVGITLDGDGNIYVVDIERGLVVKFRLLPPLAPAAATPPA